MKLVYRHYAFLGQESVWAAEASECAGEQGAFWPYFERLSGTPSTGRNTGAFGRDALKRFAGELGLAQGQFDACFDSGRYAVRVREETNQAIGRGITSTPSVFVNGQKLAGVPPWEDLLRAILAAQTGRSPN